MMNILNKFELLSKYLCNTLIKFKLGNVSPSHFCEAQHFTVSLKLEIIVAMSDKFNQWLKRTNLFTNLFNYLHKSAINFSINFSFCKNSWSYAKEQSLMLKFSALLICSQIFLVKKTLGSHNVLNRSFNILQSWTLSDLFLLDNVKLIFIMPLAYYLTFANFSNKKKLIVAFSQKKNHFH
jgi:hypothetical protein